MAEGQSYQQSVRAKRMHIWSAGSGLEFQCGYFRLRAYEILSHHGSPTVCSDARRRERQDLSCKIGNVAQVKAENVCSGSLGTGINVQANLSHGLIKIAVEN